MSHFNDLSLEDKITHKMKLIEEKEKRKLNPVEKEKEKEKEFVKNTIRTLEEKEENLIKIIKESIDDFLSYENRFSYKNLLLKSCSDKNGKATDEFVEVIPRLTYTYPSYFSLARLKFTENIFCEYSSWSKYKKHFKEELKVLNISSLEIADKYIEIEISLKK